jgi:hypothetical protein
MAGAGQEDTISGGGSPKISRPSTERYRVLVEGLVRADQSRRDGDDDLAVSLTCLVEVVRFLDADKYIVENGLSGPLAALGLALHDWSQGARHPVFDRPRKGGRPQNVSFAAQQAILAAAVTILIKAGESRPSAAKFVAAELRKNGMNAPGGKPISSDQILGWRDRIARRAPPLTKRIYKSVLTGASALPRDSIGDRDHAREVVIEMVLGLPAKGYVSRGKEPATADLLKPPRFLPIE